MSLCDWLIWTITGHGCCAISLIRAVEAKVEQWILDKLCVRVVFACHTLVCSQTQCPLKESSKRFFFQYFCNKIFVSATIFVRFACTYEENVNILKHLQLCETENWNWRCKMFFLRNTNLVFPFTKRTIVSQLKFGSNNNTSTNVICMNPGYIDGENAAAENRTKTLSDHFDCNRGL